MYTFNLEHLKEWQEGAQIAAEAQKYGKHLIKEGASVLEVTQKIEEKIKSMGGECAFPVNISRNEVAAHYTAKHNDPLCFGKDVVKLDIGAHKDGFMGDTAITIDLTGNWTEMVKASLDARKNAVKLCTPGSTLGEIGKAANETIESYGFKTIRNLSGHGIARYDAHTWPTVPNYDTHDTTELEEGMIIAIEPFATNGVGLIKDTPDAEIYNVRQFKPMRLDFSRKILQYIEKKYKLLPFSKRDLSLAGFSEAHVKITLQQLELTGSVEKHAPLVEKAGGMVTQSEVTLMVKDAPIILTKIDE